MESMPTKRKTKPLKKRKQNLKSNKYKLCNWKIKFFWLKDNLSTFMTAEEFKARKMNLEPYKKSWKISKVKKKDYFELRNNKLRH